jgi:hypothetical protein
MNELLSFGFRVVQDHVVASRIQQRLLVQEVDVVSHIRLETEYVTERKEDRIRRGRQKKRKKVLPVRQHRLPRNIGGSSLQGTGRNDK